MNSQGDDIAPGHAEGGRDIRAAGVVGSVGRDAKRRVMPFGVVALRVLVVDGNEFLALVQGNFPTKIPLDQRTR